MTKFVDFQQVKEHCSMRKAVELLGLTVKQQNQQLRGACPTCASGGDRVLAITPDRNLFYCFSAQVGGDQIELVVHIKGCSKPEAAQFLMGDNKTTSSPNSSPTPADGFPPLDYLDHEHPSVLAVGFAPEDAERLGIGYANKGILRGTVAIPLRTPEGVLVGYAGITEATLPKELRFPETNIVTLKRGA